MIRGIGLDIAEIARFDRLVEDAAFMNRVFSRGEREYIRSKGRGAAATAAGMFCAKEALSKALGCGLSGGLLRDAEVAHGCHGEPSFRLSGALSARCEGLLFHLSITHSDLTASAVVVGESVRAGDGGE